MSQKKFRSRRMAAAVLAGGLVFSVAAPAVNAAPVPAEAVSEIPAGDFAQHIQVELAQDLVQPGFGETELPVSLDVNLGSDYVLTGDPSWFVQDPRPVWQGTDFKIKLGDQPQVVKYLVAKHTSGLVGSDILIELTDAIVAPAYLPWPDSITDSALKNPTLTAGVNDKGFFEITYPAGEQPTTTSADFQRIEESLQVLVDGVEQHWRLQRGDSFICDEAGSDYAGKVVEFRSNWEFKDDFTARHASTMISCPAFEALSLKLTQESTSTKAGEAVTVGIEHTGTYGKAPVISWKLDGKVVAGETGESFTVPDDFKGTVHATVTVEDRDGQQITRTIGWMEAKPIDPVDPEPTDPTDPVDPAPVDPVIPDEKDPDESKKPVAPGTKPDPKPIKPGPDSKPSVDTDDDDDQNPIKSECEGLCDGAIGDPKPVKPSPKPVGPVITDWIKPTLKPISGQPGGGISPVIKPRLQKHQPTSTPGVMDTLSEEALSHLG